MTVIRAYMRASTEGQDATRAEAQLTEFAEAKGHKIAKWYVENESGATLKRPQLMKLLDDSLPGDVLLLEQVDRLSRLTAKDWELLKALIQSKGLLVVSIDLPTSHSLLDPVAAGSGDDFTRAMLKAINGMLLDMLGAVARKDYEDRRRRQSQGIAKAKELGKFRGRQPDKNLHESILKLRAADHSYSDIENLLGASRATIAKVVKQHAEAIKSD